MPRARRQSRSFAIGLVCNLNPQHTMSKRITLHEASQYSMLAAQARKVSAELDALALQALQADIPEASKVNIFKWLERAEPFSGLAYFLTPQPEWTGGDSSDPKNTVLTEPHIASSRIS